MSNRRVKLSAASGNYEAVVDLIDDPGPLNTWKSRTAGAWGSDQGTFLNQANTGSARGCGVLDCWTLQQFDFDVNKPGDTGTGTNADAGGDFPVGDLTWEVVA